MEESREWLYFKEIRLGEKPGFFLFLYQLFIKGHLKSLYLLLLKRISIFIFN